MEDVTSVDLRGLADKGFIRFSIKAEDTPQNVSIHNAFKEFCSEECDNNYTLGLRKLLENYENDIRIEMLWEAIGALREENVALSQRIAMFEPKPKVQEKNEVF